MAHWIIYWMKIQVSPFINTHSARTCALKMWARVYRWIAGKTFNLRERKREYIAAGNLAPALDVIKFSCSAVWNNIKREVGKLLKEEEAAAVSPSSNIPRYSLSTCLPRCELPRAANPQHLTPCWFKSGSLRRFHEISIWMPAKATLPTNAPAKLIHSLFTARFN